MVNDKKKQFQNKLITIIYLVKPELWEKIQFVRIKLRAKSSSDAINLVLNETIDNLLNDFDFERHNNNNNNNNNKNEIKK